MLGVLALPEKMREKKPFFWGFGVCSRATDEFVDKSCTTGAGTTRIVAGCDRGGETFVSGSGPALSSWAGLMTRPSSTRDTSIGAGFVGTWATVTVLLLEGTTTTVFVGVRGATATGFVRAVGALVWVVATTAGRLVVLVGGTATAFVLIGFATTTGAGFGGFNSASNCAAMGAILSKSSGGGLRARYW